MRYRHRILPSEITPEHVYFDRRQLLAGTAALAALGTPLGAGLAHAATEPTGAKLLAPRNTKLSITDEPNSWADVTGYNNFYEFGTDKDDPAANSGRFKPTPWSVTVDGEAEVKGTFTLEDILKPVTLEERVYRLRCVEAWSMVIPWAGFPLADLLARFKPTSRAYAARKPRV